MFQILKEESSLYDWCFFLTYFSIYKYRKSILSTNTNCSSLFWISFHDASPHMSKGSTIFRIIVILIRLTKAFVKLLVFIGRNEFGDGPCSNPCSLRSHCLISFIRLAMAFIVIMTYLIGIIFWHIVDNAYFDVILTLLL